MEVTVYRLNAVAVHTFLLDGPEPLLRHLGLSEADTYITKHRTNCVWLDELPSNSISQKRKAYHVP